MAKKKIIKTFCLTFYDGEEELVKKFNGMKSKTRTNTIKKLLTEHLTNDKK